MDDGLLASTLAVLNQRMTALVEELRAIRQLVEETLGPDEVSSGDKAEEQPRDPGSNPGGSTP